jgi:hypothetical protein
MGRGVLFRLSAPGPGYPSYALRLEADGFRL